jgi:hypothetical protein
MDVRCVSTKLNRRVVMAAAVEEDVEAEVGEDMMVVVEDIVVEVRVIP